MAATFRPYPRTSECINHEKGGMGREGYSKLPSSLEVEYLSPHWEEFNSSSGRQSDIRAVGRCSDISFTHRPFTHHGPCSINLAHFIQYIISINQNNSSKCGLHHLVIPPFKFPYCHHHPHHNCCHLIHWVCFFAALLRLALISPYRMKLLHVFLPHLLISSNQTSIMRFHSFFNQ